MCSSPSACLLSAGITGMYSIPVCQIYPCYLPVDLRRTEDREDLYSQRGSSREAITEDRLKMLDLVLKPRSS